MTTMPDFRCIVSADLFRRAMCAQSIEETRYYLHGVFVEPHPDGGAILTATDGHWMISIRDPRAHVVGTGIVKLHKQVAAALRSKPIADDKLTGAGSERLLVVTCNGSVSQATARVASMPVKRDDDKNPLPYHAYALDLVETYDLRIVTAQFWGALIDGTFPDYRKVADSTFEGSIAGITLNPALIAKAGEAFAPANLDIAFEGGGTANGLTRMLITPKNGVVAGVPFDGFALVMPMMPDGKRRTAPSSWAIAAQKAAA